MKILKDVIKYFKELKQNRIFLKEGEIKMTIWKLEKELKLLRMEMSSKYCAIRDGVCTKQCVHFYEGELYRWVSRGEDEYYINKPRCKLWK